MKEHCPLLYVAPSHPATAEHWFEQSVKMFQGIDVTFVLAG
jgi:hypothetical protein